jgi:hypothetical protein
MGGRKWPSGEPSKPASETRRRPREELVRELAAPEPPSPVHEAETTREKKIGGGNSGGRGRQQLGTGKENWRQKEKDAASSCVGKGQEGRGCGCDDGQVKPFAGKGDPFIFDLPLHGFWSSGAATMDKIQQSSGDGAGRIRRRSSRRGRRRRWDGPRGRKWGIERRQ